MTDKGQMIYNNVADLVELTYTRLKNKPREKWDGEDFLCARLIEFDQRLQEENKNEVSKPV